MRFLILFLLCIGCNKEKIKPKIKEVDITLRGKILDKMLVEDSKTQCLYIVQFIHHSDMYVSHCANWVIGQPITVKISNKKENLQ